MAMELVTGYAGKAHVTSYQDAAMATSANNIRIYDGVALIGGKAVVIDRDTYQDVAIANGTVGKYRNDIIYIKYTKDAFTGVESVTFDVKQGAAGNSGIDPALTTNNLYSTGTLTSEIPFKRVRLNGLAIESVENMHDNVPSLTELNRNFKESVYADGYMVVDIGALPNNSTKSVPTNIPSASEYWISDAWCKSRTTGQVSPMPYIDASTWSNAIGITISASKNIVVTTKADWSAYSGKAVIAYKLSFI